MKRSLGVLLVLLPSIAAAQEGVVLPSGPAQDRQAPAAARPADSGGKRRPSMVGYVNDSDIQTGVRVRYDSAWEVQAPDRAEFFYAKCGCYRGLAPTNPAYDPDAPGPGPGVVTDLKFKQLLVLGEYAFSPRASAFATLPVRFLRPEEFAPGSGSFGDANGISDLQFGAKGGLVSDDRRQITASLTFSAPSGDSLKGLGTNHWSVEPALLYHERASDRISVEAQLGEVFPIDGSAGVPTASPQKFAGKVLYYGFGPSVEVFRRGEFAVAPVVELVGWHVINGYQTLDHVTAKGTDIVNVKVGGRVLMRNNSSIYVGWGKVVSDDLWYDHILRLEYRVGMGRR
jgi:hypothetical protein